MEDAGAALLTPTGAEKHDGGGGEEGTTRVLVNEVKRQLYLAGPLVAWCLLQNVVQMISVMFVGHLGELALSSASVATSFAGVTGFSFMAGMSSSLDTLCGQAFGAGHHRMLGVYKQRAMLVLALACAPVAALWACAGDILARAGLDPAISAGAGAYIRRLVPALLAYGALQCHVRFLQTQNLVVPVVLSSGATALAHVPVCWLMVRRLGMGANGAALANAVTYLANLCVLAAYVRLSPACRRTWTGFSREAFRGVGEFLKLALPSAVMVCMKWWSFELLVLLSGLLPNPKLETAVLSICLNTSSLAATVPVGLGAAISTRVSNELGAGRPQAARHATRVVMVLALAVGVSQGIGMLLLRNLWGYMYSSEDEVRGYIARMMPILAVAIVFDGMQFTLSGVVRGCGRQNAGAAVNLTAYYLAGIPAACVFAFIYHLGGTGLWFGILSGLLVQMVLLFAMAACTNWNLEAMKANERLFNSAISVDTTP